ncbi:hypothetical protein COLO4_24285 [Corchorus olitorius]|nr:hypothetical protein COLO4_24285 [Corchorus olitorius]
MESVFFPSAHEVEKAAIGEVFLTELWRTKMVE